jgi:isoquinoline 1-oxidoreductase alpha subunit
MWIILNGTRSEVPDGMGEDRLLWVLRDHFALNGPRYGCGVGSCGACTVHVDGQVQHACLMIAKDAAGREVTTLEGIGAGEPRELHPVQKAWIDHSVPQCGYCQNGQIMTAVAVLKANPKAGNEEISQAMDGVICRCGTYERIRAAIKTAQSRMQRRG